MDINITDTVHTTLLEQGNTSLSKILLPAIFAILLLLFILYIYKIIKKISPTIVFYWRSWSIRYDIFPKLANFFEPDFFSLLPNDNLEWNKTFDALHWALKDSKINNIAITGYFGSGKSSFWESYRKRVTIEKKDDNPIKGYNILNISLAKFSPKCEDSIKQNNKFFDNCKYDIQRTKAGYKIFSDKGLSDYDLWKIHQEQKKETEELEIAIERGILEQIFYSIDDNKIPASRFKKTKELSFLSRSLYTTLIISIIACFLFFSNIGNFQQIFSQHTQSSYICTILLSLCIFIILPYIHSFRLTKISCHQFDIHFDQNKGNLFSQNITELVYFFEKNKKSIIVFEDLDRFYTPTIFSKLRELNHILNNTPKINKNLKFIYMIRDDIFSKYERTKFFDFIIPIVPVLTKDNATGFILKEMRNIEIDCGRQYIEDISPFLSDLRLLKNCENEYKIYKEVNESFLKTKLNNKDKTLNQSTCQWIFSMILYKNLYPKDFQKLLQHEGLLYYCIHKAKIDYFKKLDEKKGKGN